MVKKGKAVVVRRYGVTHYLARGWHQLNQGAACPCRPGVLTEESGMDGDYIRLLEVTHRPRQGGLRMPRGGWATEE